MSQQNYCSNKGRLVCGKYAIPEAPYDFVWDSGPMTGCNNLLCGDCGGKVQQWPGLTLEGDSTREDPEARLYKCSCNSRVERLFRDIESEGEDWNDPIPNWYCVGHPQLTVGDAVDGIDINDNSELNDLIGQSLAGTEPAEAPPFTKEYPACWVHRLYHLFLHVPLGSSISTMIASHLESDSTSVLSASVDFFRREPLAPGVELLLDNIGSSADSFVQVPDPHEPGVDIAHALRIVLGLRAGALLKNGGTLDLKTLEAMRVVMLWPPPNSLTLLRSMLNHDKDWMIRNSHRILQASQTELAAGDLVYMLDQVLGEEAIQIIVGLGNAGIIGLPEFLAIVNERVHSQGKNTILAELQGVQP